MPIQILMPALSPTMTEGKLTKWMVKEGDEVSSGDIIAEIETDKATMELEAVDEGTIGKILVKEGTEGVEVNLPIGILLEEGEDEGGIKDSDSTVVASPDSAPGAQTARALSEEPPAAKEEKPALESKATKAVDSGARIFASPLAKRIAVNAGLDLGDVSGSGPNGRIVKSDVEKAMSGGAVKRPSGQKQGAAAGSSASSKISDFGQSFSEEANSNVRKVIARRLLEAKQNIPHFYLTIECNIDELLALRKRLNSREGVDYKISVNDFVIKAVAVAMRKVPMVNATWTDEAIRVYDNVDVAVAVATDDGLITPIIRNADQKGLLALSNEMKELAGRARENKLKPEEFQGGGFSISNLGMYGIKEFSAIINPPQSAILAVGAGEQRPIVKDGALAIGTVMSCTMSCDHRVVDGAVGAEFLAAFKPLIEDPLSLLL
ncbi:MAG: pyruvate dehydrogenase complex dihydrolipoamide acetyltransferase [Rhodospirillaceae bacterium]|nr:pyruvate dehydrogenase complex dihydrolipoamide acetyltransferase [Rhodospirillaceae bacterium]